MHRQGSILENCKYKIPWDFEKQTDPLIPDKRPDHVIITKNENLPSLTDHLISARRSDFILNNKK